MGTAACAALPGPSADAGAAHADRTSAPGGAAVAVLPPAPAPTTAAPTSAVPTTAAPTTAVPTEPDATGPTGGRRTTAADLQALLDAAGEVCVLPGGVVEVPPHTRLVIPRSMRIDGNGTVLRVTGDEVPRQHLLDASGLPDGSYLEVHDLTVQGPDTTGWAATTECKHSAIAWVLYRTWGSRMVVRRVTTTGGYSSGVIRSGGGHLEVTDCDLGGWVDGLSCFESHGGTGSLLVRDTVLRAPARSKYDSVGAYVHPHLDVALERVTGIGWNRYVLYLNGTMQSRGDHRLTEVEAVDCSLVQTGSGSTTTLLRCRERGTPANGGSYLKGEVLSIGCTWEGAGMIGVLPDAEVTRRFVGDAIRPRSTWMALGDRSAGTVEVVGATVRLAGRTALLKLVGTSRVAATVTSTTVDADPGTVPIFVGGGSVRLVDTPRPAGCRTVAPGRIDA